MSWILITALAVSGSAANPLDQMFSAFNKADTPGCAVDVRRGRDTLAQRNFGMANLETNTPITADTVFEAGSVSKQFIGAGIALLATRHRLSLDDKLRRWLPELPALYEPVTIRMALNHTSGIRNWDNLAELTGWNADVGQYTQEWVLHAVARQSRLNFTPGTEYLYSNSNYALAALVIARASGQSLNDFSRKELFAPFGMTHSEWRDDFRRIIKGRAQAYLPGDREGWRLDMPFSDVVGPGGLMTTVGDLQHWNEALANPRDQDREWVAMIAEPGKLTNGTAIRYGLGLELDKIAGADALSHAGATASYRAWLGRFPQTGLSVALLCNSGSINTEDLGLELAALYQPKPSLAVETLIPNAVKIAGIAGIYRNMANDSAVEVEVENADIRFNGGARFIAITSRQLATPDGKRSAVLIRSFSNEVEEIELTRVANAPVRLVRTEAWKPDAKALKSFEGRYESADIVGEQTIKFENGALFWLNPKSSAQPLRPIYRDAFEAPDSSWTLRFLRGADRRVIGFDVSITRARQIRFGKTQ